MKALVYTGTMQSEIREVDDPDPTPDEVLVDLKFNSPIHWPDKLVRCRLAACGSQASGLIADPKLAFYRPISRLRFGATNWGSI